MKENLEPYTIKESSTNFETLLRIDKNQKGFLIVLDEREKVVGVVTDGDLRRGFLKGYGIHDQLKKNIQKNVRAVNITDTLEDVIKLFKDTSITFVPILSLEGKLENIITKRQLHSLFLLDIQTDLSYDFLSLDEAIIDYELFQRPWGIYKTTILNDYFQSKVISIKPKGMISLQMHHHREEYWIVAHGRGTAQLGASSLEVKTGSFVFIPKECKHRLTNVSDNENLIIIEVQIGNYFGEDDIIRFEDKYGRIGPRHR